VDTVEFTALVEYKSEDEMVTILTRLKERYSWYRLKSLQ